MIFLETAAVREGSQDPTLCSDLKASGQGKHLAHMDPHCAGLRDDHRENDHIEALLQFKVVLIENTLNN
ncbi:hypothetical protein GCM10017653_44540 [Ancylobacter defluvii]|uniref:Uncharacterized protein n=1 Tax=Ancylobacter defluvii TaxID=1282440 RepID=A0A9W6K1Q3_9HYPH|nr:hypothetical protein GCM10017653_44540 [Ancylobacter defluvii]